MPENNCLPPHPGCDRYVTAGPWTPEATVENPEAVRQIHRDFARSGADVLQAFTFYASEDKLENRGNYAADSALGFGVGNVNQAACDIVREVADEFGCLVAGGICQCPAYLNGDGKEAVQAQFRKQLDVFKANKVDFMIAEYFEHVEECLWAIETVKEYDMICAANLCCGHVDGDMHGVPIGECAVQMAQAGAEIIGLNCHFGPKETLGPMCEMKKALEAAGLMEGRHLMCQPLGYNTPDCKCQGFIDLPEFPFALEPRICTRAEMRQYAREAFESGIHYVGGCCGFQPYHIRACAEELSEELGGRIPIASKKGSIVLGEQLCMHTKPWVRARANPDYWAKIKPASGRPDCASVSTPDQWGNKIGETAKQQREATVEGFERSPDLKA